MTFSYRSYCALVKRLVKKHGPPVLPSEVKPGRWTLRHDVDYSLDAAWEMAWREKVCCDVNAVYYIMPCSDWYNPLGRSSAVTLKDIKKDGHEIGVHYRTEEELRIGKIMLEDVLGQPVRYSSQHGDGGLIRPIGLDGLGVVDSSTVKAEFVSDSMKRLDTAKIGKAETLQLLIHPVWWGIRDAGRDENISDVGDLYQYRLEMYWKEVKRVYSKR